MTRFSRPLLILAGCALGGLLGCSGHSATVASVGRTPRELIADSSRLTAPWGTYPCLRQEAPRPRIGFWTRGSSWPLWTTPQDCKVTIADEFTKDDVTLSVTKVDDGSPLEEPKHLFSADDHSWSFYCIAGGTQHGLAPGRYSVNISADNSSGEDHARSTVDIFGEKQLEEPFHLVGLSSDLDDPAALRFVHSGHVSALVDSDDSTFHITGLVRAPISDPVFFPQRPTGSEGEQDARHRQGLLPPGMVADWRKSEPELALWRTGSSISFFPQLEVSEEFELTTPAFAEDIMCGAERYSAPCSLTDAFGIFRGKSGGVFMARAVAPWSKGKCDVTPEIAWRLPVSGRPGVMKVVHADRVWHILLTVSVDDRTEIVHFVGHDSAVPELTGHAVAPVSSLPEVASAGAMIKDGVVRFTFVGGLAAGQPAVVIMTVGPRPTVEVLALDSKPLRVGRAIFLPGTETVRWVGLTTDGIFETGDLKIGEKHATIGASCNVGGQVQGAPFLSDGGRFALQSAPGAPIVVECGDSGVLPERFLGPL